MNLIDFRKQTYLRELLTSRVSQRSYPPLPFYLDRTITLVNKHRGARFHFIHFYRAQPTHWKFEEDKLDISEYPDSYKENDAKENLVLAYAENFRRQYMHLFRDRKPLLLNPLNECGIEVSEDV